MKFEEGLYVKYKNFEGRIKFIDKVYVTISRPSVVGNPWDVCVVVHHSDFNLIYEIPSNLQGT
jgi:hypothetical protein